MKTITIIALLAALGGFWAGWTHGAHTGFARQTRREEALKRVPVEPGPPGQGDRKGGHYERR